MGLLLYAVTAHYYLAPPGKDPSADLTSWFHTLSKGEPYTAAVSRIVTQLQSYHSAIGVPMPAGGPAPVVLQNGWTDTLFPVSEGLHYADRLSAAGFSHKLLMIFDDYGHGWAQGKAADVKLQTAKAIAFLNDVMLHHRAPPTGVIALGQTCPATAPSGPELTAGSWPALQKGVIKLSGPASQVVTSGGGSAATAAALDPSYAGKPVCNALPAARQPGTATYSVTMAQRRTLIGGLQITAHLHVVGNFPELVGRLWDVNTGTGTRQLIEVGVLRPAVDQASSATRTSVGNETATFELAPNEYTVPAGHVLELELVGSTAPWFRASNGTFRITVSHLSAPIPMG